MPQYFHSCSHSPKRNESMSNHPETWTWMFTATVFIIIKKEKQAN